MEARTPARNWLVVAFIGACVMGCGWSPRGDSAVLTDGAAGMVEALAFDQTTGQPVPVYLMAAPCETEWAGFRLHHRLVLPVGERALTICVKSGVVVETVISVIPDTLVQVVVEAPAAGQGSRLIPAEQCAVIKGTATAGRTGRRLRHTKIKAAGTSRSTYSDSLGNYRMALPGRHHRLSAGGGQRSIGIDTVVAPGESTVIDLRLQLTLESFILEALLEDVPMPWRAPLHDATVADSAIVLAVEDWIEQTESKTEDTATTRTLAAFELFGTSSKGRWVASYGREWHSEYGVQDAPPYVRQTAPCIACLLKIGGRWVAAEPWHDTWKTFPFARPEDWFPARYRKRIWGDGETSPDPLEARARAKVAEWNRRSAAPQDSGR